MFVDRRLSVVPHLKYIKKKGSTTFNLFNILAIEKTELTERSCSDFIDL